MFLRSSRRAMKVKTVLIDLSGTLHVGDEPIQGSQLALERLRRSNIKIKFVTNSTEKPLNSLYQCLQTLNFNVKKEEIFTALLAARQLVIQRNLRPFMFLENSAKEDFEGISTEDPNAVIIGSSPSCFTYENMNKAFRLILDGFPLIAINKSRYFKRTDGLVLGPGGFIAGLEYATDSQAIVVGKPEKRFFMEALCDCNCEPDKAIMIGDDARDDVSGAIQAGMSGILVKTGKYRPGDEEKFNPRPTHVCENFPSAVDYIIEHCL